MLQQAETRASQGDPTAAVVAMIGTLAWPALDETVRHAARRHLLDTVGVMIAGAAGDLVGKAETALARIRPAGATPVPGRRRAADLLDAAFLGGTAAHGIELDDGYRQGSAHPGCVVVPAALALAHAMRISGQTLLEAVVVGYETMTAIAGACHPELRQRGFHPTGATGVFGAAAAAARLLGLTPEQTSNALGLAASSASGLFAFLGGGADVKRLHAGHAAREGLQAALFAAQGIEGPPNVLEAPDGFGQAFAFGRAAALRPIDLPPHGPFRITDCYVKPYACCRHIQPAVEALIQLAEAHDFAEDDVRSIDVETYTIASHHAHAGWSEYAEAQLSFPFIMALGLRHRWIRLEHFEAPVRDDPTIARLCGLVHVRATPEQDRLYPRQRPARVTVTTGRGIFVKQATEALGAREVPFDDARLAAKFRDMANPVIGAERAGALLQQLWAVDTAADIRPLISETAR